MRNPQYEALTLDTCRFGSQAVVNAFGVVQITSQSTIEKFLIANIVANTVQINITNGNG